jgi:hypothetical protein
VRLRSLTSLLPALVSVFSIETGQFTVFPRKKYSSEEAEGLPVFCNRVELRISQDLNTFDFGIVAGGQGCLVFLTVVRGQQADSLGGEGEERMRATV